MTSSELEQEQDQQVGLELELELEQNRPGGLVPDWRHSSVTPTDQTELEQEWDQPGGWNRTGTGPVGGAGPQEWNRTSR